MGESVLGVVLAGGRGRRAGGADKGLLVWQGQPLVAHACARLRPQVDTLWIVANRNLRQYAPWADRVLPDATPGFHGPLEGVATVLLECPHDWALFAPVDLPALPRDLGRRLAEAAHERGSALAVAHDGHRRQVLCMLARPCLADAARARRMQGDGAVHAWQDACGALEVDCTAADGSFDNLNHWPA